MKKLFFMPSIMGNIFKSLNLNIDDVPWETFNEDTVGSDVFKLPKRDQELLLELNINMGNWLGLSDMCVSGYTEKHGYAYSTGIEINSFISRVENIPNDDWFGLELINEFDRPYIMFKFNNVNIREYKTLSKDMASDILDKLNEHYPSEVLISTDLARETFVA